MTIKIGCFALVDPFSTLDHQLDRVRDWGFRFADVTDTGDGAVLGNHFGFSAVASLDANPFDTLRRFSDRGLTITSFCAHSDLLDPTAPWRYGTHQIIKAVRSAATIGVQHIVTTEGEPETDFGRSLSTEHSVFLIAEKLAEPLRVAEDHGVAVLLEPHGPITGTIEGTSALLEAIESPAFGLNLDTGNAWLAGTDPVQYVQTFGERIRHVHWKDLGAAWEAKRGEIFGCGMSDIALGTGVVDIEGTFRALEECGFDGYSTLEIGGDDAVLESARFLEALGAER